MTTAVLFAALAAIAAVGRAVVGKRFNVHNGLALGTLAVNLIGSFLLGVLSELDPPTYTVLGVGMLGAFTTFSSFARDVVALAEIGRRGVSALYLGATVAGCLGAAALGMALSP